MRYMHGMETGQDMTIFHEELTKKQVYLEKIMLGLRRAQGIVLDEVMDMLHPEEKLMLLEKISQLESEGFIKQRDGRLMLTPVGLSVENNIALRLSL
jgi:Coproporphyrinogen III oxidase and related Fe-S oxidoreductases